LTQINAVLSRCGGILARRRGIRLSMTAGRHKLWLKAGHIISTGKGRWIEMPTTHRLEKQSDRGLVAPIAVALAVKVAALAILYFAFFLPPAAPTPERSATAIFALPTGR
jgi:hypothetical protein